MTLSVTSWGFYPDFFLFLPGGMDMVGGSHVSNCM